MSLLLAGALHKLFDHCPNLIRADFVAAQLALEELNRAREKFPAPQNSAHEGFAVLYEEVDELWDVVKDKHRTRGRLSEESIQTAAMALRFHADVARVANPTSGECCEVIGEADGVAEAAIAPAAEMVAKESPFCSECGYIEDGPNVKQPTGEPNRIVQLDPPLCAVCLDVQKRIDKIADAIEHDKKHVPQAASLDPNGYPKSHPEPLAEAETVAAVCNHCGSGEAVVNCSQCGEPACFAHRSNTGNHQFCDACFAPVGGSQNGAE